jgi:isopentenyl-diphosphate delta-isomerase
MKDTALDVMIPAWVDGILTPVEKLEVHQRGLRHKAVSVFLLAGDKVLLQQRAMCKYHTPGLWANTCCTHPDWDEDAAFCAERRLADELGIVGVKPAFVDTIEYRADVFQGLTEHDVVDVFVGQVPKSLRIDPNPAEVMSYRWMTLAEIDQAINTEPAEFTPWVKIYMHKFRERIFG